MTEQKDKEHDIDYADPEEEQKEKKVELPEVKKVTGEESEECIFKMRAKLYRFRDDQWKERGTGNFKLMRHKENKKVRGLMRQEKTLKPVANFLVQESPLCDLVPMKNNDKSFLWTANDFSEEEQKLEKLCLRLQNTENAQKFKEAFEEAQKFNKLVKEGKPESELVMAPVVEDKEEAEVDDADINKPAEGDKDDDEN